MDGNRIVVARQGRRGPDALQKQSSMLEVRIDHMDGGSGAVPHAELRCLSASIFRGDSQFNGDVVTSSSRAAENVRAKPAIEPADVLEVPVADVEGEPGR